MTTVILPVLDEAAALGWVLDRMPPGFTALVVDNGSTDGSARIARDHGAEVVHEPQRGFGSACWAGLMAATSEIVCFMDADSSLDPADLPTVAGPVESGDLDLCLGRRRADRHAWPIHARLGNRVVAWELARRGGPRLADIGPMRAAHRQPLIALGMADRRSGWPLEMVARAAAAGWQIGEVPVRYRARRGRSKVTGTLRGTVQAVGDMSSILRAVGVSR